MPKDEFDLDDPLELNGVGLACDEDTTEAMTECFIEEFMRLGHNHKRILAMFRNPHYLGMNMVLQNRGEQFVRDYIADVFARWGREVTWASSADKPLTPALSPADGAREKPRQSVGEASVRAGCRTFLFPLSLRGGEGQGEGAAHILADTSDVRSQLVELDGTVTDPMGVPIPKLNV